MTTRELELLELAKQFIKLNETGPFILRLTGSLMLALRGIEKRNEAHDIDFLISPYTQLCATSNDPDLCPITPDGHYFLDYEGGASDCKSICYIRESDKLKIDFLQSDEDEELIDGIPCGSVYECLFAKDKYSINDINALSRNKHTEDIHYIIKHNQSNEDVKDFTEEYEIAHRITFFPKL